jgi:ATP-binding cassette subfamily F protein 3
VVKKEAPAPPVKQQAGAPVNKEQKKELQKVQRQFQQVEEKIAALNTTIAKLEAALIDPSVYSDKTKFLEAEQNFKKADAERKQLNAEYEKLFEKIIELEQ